MKGRLLPFLAAGWLLAFAAVALGAPPDQTARWRQAKLDPRWSIALNKAVAFYQRTHARYEATTVGHANPVPAQVVFTFHGRESSWDFTCHLHEGSPLSHRTRYVPKGRLPNVEPPYAWEVSARDALYDYEHLDRRDWSDLASALQAMESYNGLGIQQYHPDHVSGYLWSGTSLYWKGGKYTGDGHWDGNARDKQLGCAAILLRMRERGISLPAIFAP